MITFGDLVTFTKEILNEKLHFLCSALCVTIRKQTFNVAKASAQACDPNSLKEFESTLDLNDRWAGDLLRNLDWTKHK